MFGVQLPAFTVDESFSGHHRTSREMGNIQKIKALKYHRYHKQTTQTKTPWMATCMKFVLLYSYCSDLHKVCVFPFLPSEMVHVISYYWLPTATVLFTDPQDVTVEVNQWAQFNCTVHCNYTVSWYMAGHSSAIKRNNTVPGLEIKRWCASRCTSDQKMHFFEVRASGALNASVFYCGANESPRQRSRCRCASERCYSRPALLTGRPVWNDAFLVSIFL